MHLIKPLSRGSPRTAGMNAKRMTAIRTADGGGARPLRAALVLVAAVVFWPVLAAAERDGNVAAMREVICRMIDGAAAANHLPSDFLTRVIWQESRFRSNARSPAGAEGVAQFMPQTAVARGLSDPDDPAQAIAQAARFLANLYVQFGNLGLAAAAYNAGGGRVTKWLQGQSELPGETRRYVFVVTGYGPESWRGRSVENALPTYQQPCMAVTDELARTAPQPAVAPKAPAAVARLDGSLAKVIELLQGRPQSRRAAPSPSQVSVDALCASIRMLGANCQVVTQK